MRFSISNLDVISKDNELQTDYKYLILKKLHICLHLDI